MKIGIVGDGVIGNANKKGLTIIGNEVIVHDKKYNTSINDLFDTEIIFICVPTPSLPNGDCDTSIVEDVIKDLIKISYEGIIAIRSTVKPGFTSRMNLKYKNNKICFVPEFLRERMAIQDFIENHEILVVGTESKKVANIVKKAHGDIPKNFVKVSSTEAELIKYYNNSYAATKVIFANIFYEISKDLNCDYNSIKNAFIKTGKAVDQYLDVNENLRGYGGMCLPKDISTINQLLNELNIDFKMFDSIIEDNSKLKKTVFNNMRLE